MHYLTLIYFIEFKDNMQSFAGCVGETGETGKLHHGARTGGYRGSWLFYANL